MKFRRLPKIAKSISVIKIELVNKTMV